MQLDHRVLDRRFRKPQLFNLWTPFFVVADVPKDIRGIWSNDGVTHPERVCGYHLGVFIEIDVRLGLAKVEEFEDGQIVALQEFAVGPA